MKLKCVHRSKWLLQCHVFSGSCPLKAVSAAKRKPSRTMLVAQDWFKEDVSTEKLLTALQTISWHSLVLGMAKRFEKDSTEVTGRLDSLWDWVTNSTHSGTTRATVMATMCSVAVWLPQNTKSSGTPSFKHHGSLAAPGKVFLRHLLLLHS